MKGIAFKKEKEREFVCVSVRESLSVFAYLYMWLQGRETWHFKCLANKVIFCRCACLSSLNMTIY